MTPEPATAIAARKVEAGAGATWWADGFRLLRAHAGTWTGLLLAYFAITIVLNNVPRIGAVAEWLLGPVLLGGIMRGCDAERRGEPLRVGHLFDGFRGPHFVPLLRISLWNFAFCAVGLAAALAVIGTGVGFSGIADVAGYADDPLRLWETLGFTYLALVVLTLLWLAVLGMANWFAPALVALHGAPALSAMKASFAGCLRNWLPFLVYGVIGIAILIACGVGFAVLAGLIGFETLAALFTGRGGFGAFSLGIGVLIVLGAVVGLLLAGLVFSSTYASYRDAFAADAAPPQA